MDVLRAHAPGRVARTGSLLALLVLLVAVTGLAFGAGPARAATGTGSAPYAVTLSLSAEQVVPGGTVTFAGGVRTASGAPATGRVTVQKRLSGATSWTNWRRVALDPSGAYAVAVRMTTADRVWQFRARMPSDGAANLAGRSPTRTLRVTVPPAPYSVTLSLSAEQVAPGATVTYSGAVLTSSGAPATGRVTVQKRLSGATSWTNWRRVVLDPSGAYAVAVRMTTADRVWQFRARMPSDGAANLTGVSGVPALVVESGGHPEVVAVAQSFLGVPYLYGGASPAGFDCSGLAMYCYAQAGVAIPRTATAQQKASAQVALGDLQPGDLVFFGDAEASYHVGIYVGGGTMIHAPHTGAVVCYGSVAGAWTGGRF